MINPLNLHYSFTNPASIHDEEALTALELAGRQGAKINEVVNDQNTLRQETENHLTQQDTTIDARMNKQDTTIDARMNKQDANIEHIRTVTVPADVSTEVQKQIKNGTFDEQIDDSLNHLNERVDSLLGLVSSGSTSGDAELYDARVDFEGGTHVNAGSSIRESDKVNSDNTLILVGDILTRLSHFEVVGYTDALSNVSITSGEYIVKKDLENAGTVYHNDKCVLSDYMDILEYPELIISAKAQHSTCILSLYDVDKNYLTTHGNSSGVEDSDTYSEEVVFTEHPFTLLDILAINPKTRYIRIGSYINALVVQKPIRKETLNTLNEMRYGYSNEDLVDNSASYNVQSGYYVNKKITDNIPVRGTLISHEKCQYSDFIDIVGMADIFVTAQINYGVSAINYYDEDHNFLGLEGPWEYLESNIYFNDFHLSESICLEKYPTCRYLRLSSYLTPLVIKNYQRYDIQTLLDKMESVYSHDKSNVLWGKKLVACGDSFTQGDFSGFVDENGLSYKNSPVIYDSVMGVYKTYPWWIAKRNNMTLVNEALCGSIMALDKTYVADPNNVDIYTKNPFSVSRYKSVPEDADYILIMFGINDVSNTNLGTLDDTTNDTFYGAFNVVLKYLIENRPHAKIGVMVPNYNLKSTYYAAILEVSEKWGIPVLDMKRGENVPMTLYKEGACDEAIALRRAQFVVSSTNGHPNVQAHEYQSTYIEDFLRRL